MDTISTDLQAAIEKYHGALQHTDLATVLEAYAEGALLVRPDGTVLETRQQQTAMWNPYIEHGSKKTVCESITVQVFGQMAYELASYHFAVSSHAPGIEEGHYLAVWRQQNGGWHIDAQIFAAGGVLNMPLRVHAR